MASFRSSALPQKLPFPPGNLYSRSRPENTIPGIIGNVLLAAIVAFLILILHFIRAILYSASSMRLSSQTIGTDGTQ